MAALPAALAGTLLFGLLGAAALRGLKTGQTYEGITPPPLVRLSALFALAFSAFGLILLWWTVVAQLR